MSANGDELARNPSFDALEQRLRYLELLKAFHEEMLKVIRIYSSSEHFTSERCLQEIVNFIQKKFATYLVSVLLVDELSNELVLYVCAGEEMMNPLVRNFRLRVGEGVCGGSAQTGAPAIVNDVTTEPRFIRGPLPKTQSELVVPIKIKGRVIGVLDLQDQERSRFTHDFAQVMEQVSFDLAFLLENKKLHDDLREYSRQLEQKVETQVTQLKRSEERYRNIVEGAADPIFTVDLEGRFTWANRATFAMCAYEARELESANITKLLKKGHAHTIYKALREAAEGRDTCKKQVEVITRRGDPRIVEFSCIPIRENGSIAGAEFLLRDITEKVYIEKARSSYIKTLDEAVKQQTKDIKDTQRAAILAMANLAESIDNDTGGHINRIQHYARVLAEEMRKLSKYKGTSVDREEYVELVTDLSPLHDLGKVGIRDYILQKPDRLTEEEFETMKEHSEIGARALRMAGESVKRDGLFSIAEMIARHHHQKWDGTGYPVVETATGESRPLRGDEIPLCARLVALADVYDALTSKRPYKMPFPHEKAREMIAAQSGKHFDPDVVQAFLRREQEFVRIRSMFPDTQIPEGKPFVLPARDRVQPEAAVKAPAAPKEDPASKPAAPEESKPVQVNQPSDSNGS
ncbi:MAG: PAS domain S-box protein [Planctomycetes bacterium]|nr:PAS domain S-box protein [Planctomycetota bacterium]